MPNGGSIEMELQLTIDELRAVLKEAQAENAELRRRLGRRRDD